MQNHWINPFVLEPLRIRYAPFVARFAPYCGFLAVVLFWSGVLIVGVLQPEYHLLADTVSRMGRVGRTFAILINLTLIVTGTLIGLFAQRLPALNKSARFSTRNLIATFGFIGLAGAGLFPCDEICVGNSLANILHTIPVSVGFISLQLGLLQIASTKTSNYIWSETSRLVHLVFFAGLVAITLHLLGRWQIIPLLDSFLGLSEKIYLVLLFALIALLSRRMQTRI